MATLERAGKTVGVIYISPTTIKPVIFIRQNSKAGAAEGHIYYRYQSENRLIAPTELQHIIEERIRALSETILSKHISNILANGIENSAVLNLETGVVDGRARSFVIDEELLPKIKFVKEGEFVEKSGAPTLKLIGEIKSSSKVIATKKKELIKLYPFSWTEIVVEVKKLVPRTANAQINSIIKENKLKINDKYSVYNFRNKKHANMYEKTGIIPSGTPSIYNHAAIKFIARKINSKESAQ